MVQHWIIFLKLWFPFKNTFPNGLMGLSLKNKSKNRTQLSRTPIKSYYIIYTNEVKNLYPEQKKISTQVKKTHSISNFHDNVM